MNVTRRSLLLGALSVSATPILRATPAGAASPSCPLILVVSGLDQSTDPIRIETLVAPFQIRGIACTLTIDPHDRDGTNLDYYSEMARHLRTIIREGRTDVEIGLHVETLASGDPYFQLRQISAAQAVFSRAINEYERYKSKAVTTAYTLTTTSPLLHAQDGASMRAAGIRSVIRLASGGKD
jgi:hypothetical protein